MSGYVLGFISDPGGNDEPAGVLYAWIAEHGPGNESLVAIGDMPLISATYAVAMKGKPVVAELSRVTGKRIKLVRYVATGEIEST